VTKGVYEIELGVVGGGGGELVENKYRYEMTSE